MRSKLVLLFAASAAMVAAGMASAADLPRRTRTIETEAVVPPPLPLASWSGLYVAGGGGYGLFDADSRSAITGFTPVVNGTTGGKGAFGTLQVGYDAQFNSLVAGVFADWDFGSIKGTLSDQTTGFNFPLRQSSAWAVGGRIGWLPTPQILSYFSGGYTEARFKSSTGVCAFAVGCGGFGVVMPSQDFSGYFLGGGTEVALGFAPGWSWKTEYRLARYDANTVALSTTPAVLATASIKPTVQTIRTELVYKFNWMGR